VVAMEPSPQSGHLQRPTFREAFRFWLKLGFISFGGPAGQIAIMHTELVEKKRWIEEHRFLHALNFCMLLPGPEAQQLATYIGWLLHRTWGGLAAGLLFVLPSVLVLWALAYGYMVWGQTAWVAAIFAGLKPAVLAVVIAAVLRIGRKSLKNPVMIGLAGVAFVAIYFFSVPFPWIILAAALLGWLGSRVWPDYFVIKGGHGEAQPSSVADMASTETRPSWRRSLRTAVIGVTLWTAPIFLAGASLGWKHTITEQGLFFSKAAMVTFGGAYAVLPYVAQAAVEQHAWLAPEQMLDGLGLAETTPGPLIMVVQFVGFVGAWQNPDGLPPLLAATLGALLTTWVTFVPCFLWIFLGAPHVERLHGNQPVTGALSSISAAVVGVILNLAVWFGWHVLVPDDHPDWTGILICAAALLAIVRWRVDVGWIIATSAVLGLVVFWLT
jgi:chromate transporter